MSSRVQIYTVGETDVVLIAYRCFRNRSKAASDFLQNTLFGIAPVFIDVGIGATYLTNVYGVAVGIVLLVTSACYMAVSLITRPVEIGCRTEVLAFI